MNQLPTNEIPWTQIGAFGSFAIVVLIIALWFVLKLRKGRNNPGTINTKSRCVNDGRFQTGLTNIAITKESMSEMKQDMKSLTEKTVEQTGILKGLFSETKKQTQVLEKVCSKIAGE